MSTETNIITTPSADSASSLATIAPPFAGVEPPAVQLTERQTQALALIIVGRRVSDIAQEIGVDRGTIYRWRTGDPNFIAALNRWRGAIQAETRDRLLAMSEDATDSLQKVIDEGKGGVELRLLEKMGCLSPGPDHPIDPYAVFGNGIDDETGRWRIAEGMRRAAASMTAEQVSRSADLLALGIVMDNRRTGRESPRDLLEMAGLLHEDPPPAHRAPNTIKVRARIQAPLSRRCR